MFFFFVSSSLLLTLLFFLKHVWRNWIWNFGAVENDQGMYPCQLQACTCSITIFHQENSETVQDSRSVEFLNWVIHMTKQWWKSDDIVQHSSWFSWIWTYSRTWRLVKHYLYYIHVKWNIWFTKLPLYATLCGRTLRSPFLVRPPFGS